MKLLFIQGGSRWKFDYEGNVYTDANFNENIWERYRKYCDTFTVILRKEEKIYEKCEAEKKFNAFDSQKSRFVALPDIYKPIKNSVNLRMRYLVNDVIRSEVINADKIVIRSIGTYYTNAALKWVRKLNKPYLVEETGFSFESLWYHSIRGKMIAFCNELSTKRLMKDVPFAIYVTDEALQKRYPSKGKSIGCSDVEIDIDRDVINRRMEKIKFSSNDKIILGTAAFLDVGWKGQMYVIRALDGLKRIGVNNFEYQLIGAGTGKKLYKEIKRLHLEDNVKILGVVPHEQVFDWYEQIDVYIQPSFMEGLCRSIVEAMSRACLVLCSDVGGNYELIEKQFIFQKGNVRDIERKLLSVIDPEVRIRAGKRNFQTSLMYEKSYLNNKRDNFYKDFMAR